MSEIHRRTLGNILLIESSGTPHGVIPAPKGSFGIDRDTATWYINQDGATAWSTVIGTTSGTPSDFHALTILLAATPSATAVATLAKSLVINSSGDQTLTTTPNLGKSVSVTATPLFTNAGYVSLYASRFDVTNKYVLVNAHSAIENLWTDGGTLSFWLKKTTSNNAFIAYKTKWELSINDYSAGNMALNFGKTFSSGGGGWKTTNREIGQNTWYHVAITYNSNSTANDPLIYINGSSVSVTETATPVNSPVTDAAINLYIGNWNSVDSSIRGDLDEWSLWGRVLTGAEITELYNAGHPNRLTSHSASADLVQWFRMGDQDTFPTLTDRSTVGNNGTMTNMSSADFVTGVS